LPHGRLDESFDADEFERLYCTMVMLEISTIEPRFTKSMRVALPTPRGETSFAGS